MTGFAALFLELNIAAALAITLVLLIRRPIATAFGPHAAYSLWATIPVAMIATLIPERTVETLVGEFLIGGLPASMAFSQAAAATWLAPALLTAWVIGAIALALAFIRRQRDFQKDADIGLAGPAIVGFRHPRIVTPDDFDRRFSHDERKLILTHEQVHIDRHDARINALVAVIRCAFWFNPLVHIGAKALRTDQELSCDAEVLLRRPRVRRAYAETLLKTHLESRPLPVGCYWPAESQHPLAERISHIARQPISGLRRTAAAVVVLSLTAGVGLAAWAAQPERTIFRETADVLVPFQPIPHDEQASNTTRPRLVPQSVALSTAWPMPENVAKVEIAAELCISGSGAVESAKLVKSSGFAKVDTVAIDAMRGMRFEPATRNGSAVSVCRHGFSIAYDNANRTTPP